MNAACVSDTTPPVLRLPGDVVAEATHPELNMLEWAVVEVTATDDSGSATCGCDQKPAGPYPLGITVVNCWADDPAGNRTTGSFRVTMVDTTSPALTCPQPLTVLVNTPVNDPALITFLSGAAASDLVDYNVSIAAPALSPLGAAGTRTVTFRASDDSGNSSECTSSIGVDYRFNGFFSPVEMQPVTNAVKAGSTVPLKWSLPDGLGGFFSNLGNGSLSVQSAACGSFDSEIPPEELDTSGSSGLRYDPLSNQYIFNWKTDKAKAGNCYLLSLTLNDSSRTRTSASFKLK